jgi:amino acid permease
MNSFTVAFPAKLVAATSIVSFWVPKTYIHPAVWISVFMATPLGFNMFNVRRYGEIEFWLTAFKVTSLLWISIIGILLPLDASTATRLSGTDGSNALIPCTNPALDNCLSHPGFNCSITVKLS